MLVIVGILVVAAFIVLIEVPTLLKKKLRKELWVFSLLLLFGVGLSIANSLQIDIPNPMDWITVVYKPVSDVVSGLLK